MGMGRRAMVYLGLAEEDEGYVEHDYEAEESLREPVASRPVRRVEQREVREVREREVRIPEVSGARRGRADAHAEGMSVEAATRGSAAPRLAEPMSRDLREAPESSYQITTLQPRSYNEARQIGEAFREHIPVIMNLTDMSDDDAKRLVDFAAGLIFGLHGSIEKVTNKVFLLSPSNVAVSAEDKRAIVAGGFYNQS